MLTLNHQFDLIRQSATVGMSDRVLELKASGRKIISLQVGDPDFATPQSVTEAASPAMQDGNARRSDSLWSIPRLSGLEAGCGDHAPRVRFVRTRFAIGSLSPMSWVL